MVTAAKPGARRGKSGSSRTTRAASRSVVAETTELRASEEFETLLHRASINAAQRDALVTHLRAVLGIVDTTGGYTTPEQQVTLRLARAALEEIR